MMRCEVRMQPNKPATHQIKDIPDIFLDEKDILLFPSGNSWPMLQLAVLNQTVRHKFALNRGNVPINKSQTATTEECN